MNIERNVQAELLRLARYYIQAAHNEPRREVAIRLLKVAATSRRALAIRRSLMKGD